MVETNDEHDLDLNYLAQAAGLRCPVRISTELSGRLMPNAFLNGFGISYTERIKTILGILKGSMVLGIDDAKESIPNGGMVIPFTVVTGPFIKEEPISIRAELTDDGEAAELLLSTVPNEE